MKRWLGGIAAVLIIGCTSPDDGRRSVTVDPATDGGYAYVFVGGGVAALVQGAFYDSVTGGSPVTYEFGTDECVEVAPATAPPPVYSYREVGEVAFTAGDLELVAVRDASVPTYEYGASGTFPFDVDFTVTTRGTGYPTEMIGTVHMPKEILILNAPQILPGEPMEVEFTPDTAERVVISLENVGASVVFICSVVPDGFFTVPAEVTEAVGGGYVYIGSGNFTTVTIRGRIVLLAASAS